MVTGGSMTFALLNDRDRVLITGPVQYEVVSAARKRLAGLFINKHYCLIPHTLSRALDGQVG